MEHTHTTKKTGLYHQTAINLQESQINKKTYNCIATTKMGLFSFGGWKGGEPPSPGLSSLSRLIAIYHLTGEPLSIWREVVRSYSIGLVGAIDGLPRW